MGARRVAALIKANTPIDNLSLTGNKQISNSGWAAIFNALRNNTFIKVLSLDHNSLGDIGVEMLADALKGNNSITTLDLEGNNIGHQGAKVLLEALKECKKIKDLTLMPGNDISEQLLVEMREVIQSD